MVATRCVWSVVIVALCASASNPPSEDVAPEWTRYHPAPGTDHLGQVLLGPIDIQNRVPGTSSGIQGVEEAWGFLWFVSRNNDGPNGAPQKGSFNKIFKFTRSGEYVAQFPQFTRYEFNVTQFSSPWGGRDLAVNEAANRLYYGWESGYFAWHTYNPVTGELDAGQGTRIAGYTNTIRALAIRPDNGRFIACDFANPLREFTVAGGIHASYPNTYRSNGGASNIAGMAASADGPRLWLWSQDGPAAWHEGYAIELNLATSPPTRTGREFLGAVVGNGPVNTAGGADITCHNGTLGLLTVHQASQDAMVIYSLDAACVGGCPCACNFDVSTGQGVCDIFDFLSFGNQFSAGESCACNMDTSTGPDVCDIFDFLAFGNGFNAGCP